MSKEGGYQSKHFNWKMKSLNLVSCSLLLLLLLNLTIGLQARLFFNGGLFCIFNTKRTCSYTSAVCVRIAATSKCKYYASQCKFRVEKCLGKGVYGLSGEEVDATTYCDQFTLYQEADCTA